MIRRPPRSTLDRSSAASDVYKRQPDTYDPLRFAPERAEDKADRFALIGFGGGGHKCMGMNFANNEIAVITALLLQQFELDLITRDPGIARGVGANKPLPTIARYRRKQPWTCLLYTSPSPRDRTRSRMPSSA